MSDPGSYILFCPHIMCIIELHGFCLVNILGFNIFLPICTAIPVLCATSLPCKQHEPHTEGTMYKMNETKFSICGHSEILFNCSFWFLFTLYFYFLINVGVKEHSFCVTDYAQLMVMASLWYSTDLTLGNTCKAN